MTIRWQLIALTCALGACPAPTPSPADAAGCVRGASQACACVSGASGAQVCAADGAFGPCVCLGPDAGLRDAAAEDAAPAEAGADAAAADAGPDASLDAAADAGPVDAALPAWCESFPDGYVRVAAGRFVMGSPDGEIGRAFDGREGPQHTVVLTRAYWLKVTEVTQAEWLELMPTNPSLHVGCPTCPVERVNWYDATDYANALSRSCGLAPCYPDDHAARSRSLLDLDCPGFRLPIEAEWEYAARAGTTTAYHFGPSTTGQGREPLLERYAWYWFNSGISSQPVGGRMPNPWGLYDMNGNVLEWMSDGRRTYGTSTVTDPVTRLDELGTLFRGGNFGSEPDELRSASRRWQQQLELSGSEAGFRLARTAR